MNDTNTTSNTDENAVVEAQQEVGQLLRETREQAGLDIAEVARVLRISQRYLSALEDGRNEDLPGTTYAIGFVRSYSEHLNLDGEEIVRRYKAQAEGVEAKTELIFPKPIPDSGVPGAAVLGLGVIVAAVAYGVWYYNSNADDIIVARVEAVPEHMAAPAEEKTTPTPAPEVESLVEQAVEEAPKEVPEEVAEEVAEQVVEEAPQTEVPAEVEAEPVAQEAEETLEAAPTEEPVAEEPVAETAIVEEPAVEEPVAEEVAATAPADEGDSDSRITVRAKSNSWIQIRDEALDRLLFTRLLRVGDTYEVPNRAGLRLMTGNAGALELLVDGKPVPAIGEVGEVRRNVEMDPDKLISGTAATE